MMKFFRSGKTARTVVAIAVLVVVLHFFNVTAPVEDALIRILAPVQQRLYFVGIRFNQFYQQLITIGDSWRTIEELRVALTPLMIENEQLKVLLEQNQAIAVHQAFLERAGLQAVVAQVIGSNPEANRQAIILNKGSSDGVAVGQPIITADGELVGRIITVRQHSSEAILISDPQHKVSALIQNEQQTQGVVVGQHGLSLHFELIPQGETIQEGDIVVSAGLEPAIPRGLTIGRVQRVLSEPSEPFQTATVQPLFRFENVTTVSILMPQAP